MNIGIDISQIAYPGSGVARYTEMLIRSLIQYDKSNSYVFFFSSLRNKPPSDIATLIRSQHKLIQLPIPPTLLSYMWNNLHIVPVETFTGPLDIFVSSDWTQPPIRNAKSVTIIHDLVMYVHPETSTQKTELDLFKAHIKPSIVNTHKMRLSRVVAEVDHIITDSQSTMRDAMRYLGLKESTISVVYPAVHFESQTDRSRKTTRAQFNLNKPFILTVGKMEPRKNIPKLLQAYMEAGISESVDLVVVGAQGWGTNSAQSQNNNQHIHFLGYVSDSELFALYEEALAFIYPSVYEGFGYPIIEAMAASCPVATSQVSSLGEIADGYAHLFDPHTIKEMRDVLGKLASSKEYRSRYVQKAQKYAQSFSSERFARELLAIFDQIV